MLGNGENKSNEENPVSLRFVQGPTKSKRVLINPHTPTASGGPPGPPGKVSIHLAADFISSTQLEGRRDAVGTCNGRRRTRWLSRRCLVCQLCRRRRETKNKQVAFFLLSFQSPRIETLGDHCKKDSMLSVLISIRVFFSYLNGERCVSFQKSRVGCGWQFYGRSLIERSDDLLVRRGKENLERKRCLF